MLVKVAETTFDVPKSKKKKPLKPGISKELNEAWKVYNRAFKQYHGIFFGSRSDISTYDYGEPQKYSFQKTKIK